MSNWRAEVDEALRARDNSSNRDASPPIGPNVPNVPAPLTALKAWRRGLGKLDPCEPCGGLAMGQWQTLYDAAAWLLETFGEQAARDGWTTADLFGLRMGYPGTGGLVDRLGDNRGLVMLDGFARWRSWGVPMQFNRGGGHDLPAMWELGE